MKKLLLLFLVLIISGCSTELYVPEETTPDSELQKREEIRSYFALKYNAILDWSEKFNTDNFGGYTVEIQQYLTKKNQRPIVVDFPFRLDIYLKQNNYILDISDNYGIGDKDIHYLLKVNENLVNHILSGKIPDCAVVKIDSIKKASLGKIEYSEYDYDTYYFEENETLVFYGTCLDILFYPED